MTDHPAPNPNQDEHQHNRVAYTDSATLRKVDVCSTCGHDFGSNPTDEVLERATIALHDADCPDRKCEPHTMGAYRRQARAVLAAVGPMIAAGAWDEGFWDGQRQTGEGEDGPRYANPYREERA